MTPANVSTCAPAQQLLFGEDVACAALLSDEIPPICLWWLSRDWSPGPRFGWLMTAPSLADHRIDDPTMRAVMKWTCAWGGGGCVVVNVFPYRTPDNRALGRFWGQLGPRPREEIVGRNLWHIGREMRQCRFRVAAFGNDAADIDLETCRRIWGEFKGNRDSALCIGLTKHGWPKHPLACGKHVEPITGKRRYWKGAELEQ